MAPADVVDMARRQTYDGKPVHDVHELGGRIFGKDAYGRPLRAIAIVNTENDTKRIRWIDADRELPKRGGYLADEGYESLRPRRYAVLAVFS